MQASATLQVLRNAKLWCDTESAAEAAELSAALGSTIVPSFTATKLLWLKRNEPQLFDQLAHVLLPHDYFNWFLTGKYAMEVGGGWWWGCVCCM
jgi:xylulokinase